MCISSIFLEIYLQCLSYYVCLKGHNGFFPCRFCLIQGERNVGAHKTTYYPVLQPPIQPGGTHRNRQWDLNQLPLQSRDSLHEHLTKISRATAAQHHDKLTKHYGVNRLSMVLRIPSLKFPDSFPHDIMHLIFENLCPTLCQQWTASGKFKNTEPADTGYRLAPHIWTLIGQETSAAYRMIPSDFIGALPDITSSKYKAKFWSFWIQYLSPPLLRNCFPNQKYYRHYCELVTIIKACLQFTITEEELQTLHESIIKWVTEYERYTL
jgi:hypothetical protein